MKVKFYKYQGTGNDFVIVDNRNADIELSAAQIKHACDRRFGIGADGLMLLENIPGYDFKMVYYNSDGNQSTMCGNGGRCLVKFAYHQKIFQDRTTFMAIDGPHEAFVSPQGWVHLKMIDVHTVEQGADYFFMNTGSPHHVKFVKDLAQYPVFGEGKSIRYSDKYVSNKGTNVNFAELQPDTTLFVRTYERGVEDETYSCGTGVTAAAIAAVNIGLHSPVQIKTLGGDLSVAFEQKNGKFENVYLNGPAEFVFSGEIDF
ncbi:MAG TPA: diaminopimelate epimerase [Cytophagales bacterium]|nr:diaminopimelate epimerase [Cytophagales bacterium]